MEMAQADNGNTPKNYSLNMFQDFVPMCVFSESNQGNNCAFFHLCLKNIVMHFIFFTYIKRRNQLFL
jgi:hypothetical protein